MTGPVTPDSGDELLVERVAAAMCNADAHGIPWERLVSLSGHGVRAGRYRRFAQEAIAAVRSRIETEAENRIAEAIEAHRGATNVGNPTWMAGYRSAQDADIRIARGQTP